MTTHPTRPAPARSACTVLAVAIATLTVFFGFTSRAGAVDNGTLGIRPATESDFFHLTLYPGSATDAVAVVTNHTRASVTLLTYPADGASTQQGRFALADPSAPRRTIGAWVHLRTNRVTVPAHAQVKIGFRLTVPVGTPPGDYAGGLIIQPPEQVGKTVTVAGQTAVRLNVIQRQGVRIYLHVAGTAIRTLHTGQLNWHHNNGTFTFDLPLTNTGNTTLYPTAKLTINSSIGTTSQLKFPTPEMLLPGDSITLHTTLPDAPLIEIGHAAADVHSEAGNSRTSTSLIYIPTTLLAGAALLLVLLTLATWRITRYLRRARQALANQANQTGRHHAQGARV